MSFYAVTDALIVFKKHNIIENIKSLDAVRKDVTPSKLYPEA